ncbi:P-loop containing nucleoside triphosphate hydrolase protein [Lasiosphaeria ovina]|uniref:P-loop containing nucleoside triphosphate hydrolase protein n=1 Tax=Lasiosphaeria ovina TaxID=92902 RepID=A0AAE0NJ19_9PEZI|nr:P-loop containing nucleoside triphosphate hydrolase protein [Lasiosphaeria ovina]
MTVQAVGLIMESDAEQEGTADKQVELTSNKHEQPETFMSEALLQKIDRLREMNIGKHVPLPQLVVVGDQSSGKSSLLESLTGIPFPSQSGLCTRYATQITQRRGSQSRVNISIIPGSDASEAHKAHVEGYHCSALSGEDFHAKFPQILQEVNARMGIRMDHSSTTGTTFSRDVLKIEICGPTEDYLTVIDVPGIFRQDTEGLTTKSDIQLVKSLVNDYIKDRRTIILAVLPCNVDIATQEILTMAKEHDKNEERTLGILTKPDRADEEQSNDVCKIVRREGLGKKLELGYYVVRSRAPGDGDAEYERREEMFNDKPWSSLPRDRVGVRPLKARLRELLVHIAQQEFPSLRKDVGRMLHAAEKNEQEQRMYLGGIARKFEELVRAGLDAQYSRHSVFKKNLQLRLVTLVVYLSETFAEALEKKGHLRNFEDMGSNTKDNNHGYEAEPPQDGIMEWLEGLYLKFRSGELIDVNGAMLSSAFEEQSSKWKCMAKDYTSAVVVAIHCFMTSMLEDVCVDNRVREELWSAILEEVLKRYKAAMEHVSFLMSVERKKRPYTLNAYFNEHRQSARGNRMAELLEVDPLYDDSYTAEQIRAAMKKQSNTEYATAEIHDLLGSYYEVARRRFVDNVYRQAVDHYLLTGPESPLGVLSQEWVMGLSIDQLKATADESPSVKERRDMLEKKIKDLRAAKETLRH